MFSWLGSALYGIATALLEFLFRHRNDTPTVVRVTPRDAVQRAIYDAMRERLLEQRERLDKSNSD
jgi:hypothetical protein